MTVAARQSLWSQSIPHKFRYVGVKLISTRGLRTSTSFSNYRSHKYTAGCQFSELKFIDANGTAKNISFNSLLTLYHKAKGIAFFTQPAQTITTVNINECFGRVFDNTTSTKYFKHAELMDSSPRPAFWLVDDPSVLYAGEDNTLAGNVWQQLGYSSSHEMWQDIAGIGQGAATAYYFLPGYCEHKLRTSIHWKPGANKR